MRYSIFILILFLFISCSKDEGKKCGEGEMVFNSLYCVSANSNFKNYVTKINFYCLNDSLLIQYGSNDNEGMGIYHRSQFTGPPLKDDFDNLFFFIRCSPTGLKSTAVVVEEESLLSNPDMIEAKIYQLSWDTPTAERLDSTTVTLRKR